MGNGLTVRNGKVNGLFWTGVKGYRPRPHRWQTPARRLLAGFHARSSGRMILAWEP